MTDFLLLRRRPFLSKQLPIHCSCGAALELASEFADETYCGVETHACSACDAPPARLKTYIDKREAAKAATKLRRLTGSGEGDP